MKLSVLIPTKNEKLNIRDCIESVSFADDIVIVDSQSIDGTIDEAEALGARVVHFHWNGKLPKKKNWAIQNVQWKNEWLLILDADERITPELAKEIETAIGQAEYQGFFLNRRFWFLGGWLNHCGYYPSWNLRLFKHPVGRYESFEFAGDTASGDNEVHEHLLLQGKAGYLSNPMLHYAYPNIKTWIEKHNRYSNWEASVLKGMVNQKNGNLRAQLLGNAIERKRWLKRISRNLPFRPTARFLYHYVLKQGFRDGYRGWVFCRLLAWYEFISIAKAHEIASSGSLNTVSPKEIK